jgi:hypothetical protein
VERLAVTAMPTSGSPDELLRWAGIDRDAIAARARALVARRGVATALLAEHSAHALADSIETHRAIVQSDNAPAIAALTRLGAARRYRDGELHFLFAVPVIVAAAVRARAFPGHDVTEVAVPLRRAAEPRSAPESKEVSQLGGLSRLVE